jgi:hypothetical protein
MTAVCLILTPMAVEKRRRADGAEIAVGLGLFAVLAGATGLGAGLTAALFVLAVGATAFALLGLVVSAVRRSLRRGFWDAARWTFGFVGSYLPL